LPTGPWSIKQENVHGYPVPRLSPGLAGASEEYVAILRVGVDSVRGLSLQLQFFQVRSSLIIAEADG
jgi:hypothetical protein